LSSEYGEVGRGNTSKDSKGNSHESGAIITMKMHRMRLITTTNCPFGIEDDETVKARPERCY